MVKTPHGLLPAIDFLNLALQKDSGVSVTLCPELTGRQHKNGKPYYQYSLKRQDDDRRISLSGSEFTWEESDVGMKVCDWRNTTYTLHPKPCTGKKEQQIVAYDLKGMQFSPGQTTKYAPGWALLFTSGGSDDDGTGFFPAHGVVILEYRRRFLIEQLVLQKKKMEEKIAKLLVVDPYIKD
jgi:hypothetical protein